MKRKLISWIIIVAFCLTLLPVLPQAAEAATTVSLGGTELQNGQYYTVTDNKLETEDASEDNFNVYYLDGTLTLKDLSFSGSGSTSRDSDSALLVYGDITLNMLGSNTITYTCETNGGTNACMYVSGDLTVQGNGSLILNGGAVTATSTLENYKSIGLQVTFGDIFFSAEGTLEAHGGTTQKDSSLSYGILAEDLSIIMDGSGTLKGVGGENASENEDCASFGIDCGRGTITVKNGTLNGEGGKSPADPLDSFYAGSSLGIAAATVDIQQGSMIATGGESFYSVGLAIDVPQRENKELTMSDGSLQATGKGFHQSYGITISAGLGGVVVLDGGSLIADAGDDCENPINEMAIRAVDEMLEAAMNGSKWRYNSTDDYIYSGEINLEEKSYFEVQKASDYDFESNAPVCEPNSIYYGQPLNVMTLSGTISDEEGNSIEGMYSWDTPDKMPDAGHYQAAWTFTPNDTSLAPIKGVAIVTVNKAILSEKQTTVGVDINAAGWTLDDVYYNVVTDFNVEYGKESDQVTGGKIWNQSLDTEIEQGVSYGWLMVPTDRRNYTSFSGSTVLWPEDSEEPDTPDTPDEPDIPDTPSMPSEPSTPSQPSEPEQPAPDVTTDEGALTTTTTAKPDVTSSGTTASATVSEAMGEAIVEQATENESNTVVIAPEMDSDITEAEVVIPAGTVEALGDDTDADLVIDTPVGKVTLPNNGLSVLAKDTDDITVSLKADDYTVEFVIADDAGAVATVNGGVKLVVPADTKAGTVAVIVNADGTREVVRKSVASGDNMIIPLDGSATIEIIDNSRDFVDVVENSWYGDAVAFASSHELFNGTSATEFSPDAGMTRGMLAAVLSNLERGDGSGLAAAFDDVADDAWYAEAIAWAAENGIVNGLGNGMFGPEELITREQMAAMLYNYADMLGVDTSARANLNVYSDADSVSSWANEVMSWANAIGIIGGTTTTTLDPQGTATRAQVAAMLERFVLLIAE